ncbi:MAG: aminoglycoside phosphotransferase [Streptosporangiaceae bacterium]|nr:aminoglycoside phosphotransferase [Streptosporangiaceae bacterium]
MVEFHVGSPAWHRVLAENYGHTTPDFLGPPRQCYSLHRTYRFDQEKYVISRVRKEPRKIPFHNQFRIMSGLHEGGVRFVEPPIPRYPLSEDSRWVDHPSHHWFVRSYVNHHPTPDWVSPDLIEDAARKLATLHTAARTLSEDHLRVHPIDLTPYDWPVSAVVDRRAHLIDHMSAQDRTPGDIELVHQSLERLSNEKADLDLGPLGITHQDLRPENVLVRDNEVVGIIDWDRAHWDHQLYDAAVGALHIAYLAPDRVRFDLADRFVAAYRDASPVDIDEAAVDWMFRYATIRNLGVSRFPKKWAVLAQAVQARGRGALGGAQRAALTAVNPAMGTRPSAPSGPIFDLVSEDEITLNVDLATEDRAGLRALHWLRLKGPGPRRTRLGDRTGQMHPGVEL